VPTWVWVPQQQMVPPTQQRCAGQVEGAGGEVLWAAEDSHFAPRQRQWEKEGAAAAHGWGRGQV
jgi:hypothetical protein